MLRGRAGASESVLRVALRGVGGRLSNVHMDRVNPSSEVGNERSSMLSLWRKSREGQGRLAVNCVSANSGDKLWWLFCACCLFQRSCTSKGSASVGRASLVAGNTLRRRLAVSIKMSRHRALIQLYTRGRRGARRGYPTRDEIRKKTKVQGGLRNRQLRPFTHRPLRRALVR